MRYKPLNLERPQKWSLSAIFKGPPKLAFKGKDKHKKERSVSCSSSVTGTKALGCEGKPLSWVNGERNCRCSGNWVSQSLWSQPRFPSTTYFYLHRVSQQAIQLRFHVFRSTPTSKAGEQPASPFTHQVGVGWAGGNAGQAIKLDSRILLVSLPKPKDL